MLNIIKMTINKLQLKTIGNADLLQHPYKLAIFCSSRCPGDIILQVQDWANQLTGSEVMPIGGFHTAVEREILRILLRARHQLAIFPARSLQQMRIPNDWKPALDAGTLCITANFPHNITRATAQTAEIRNRLVAEIADELFVPYAAPGSKTEKLVASANKNIISL